MSGGRAAYCGQCGSPVQEGDRFCGECGARVAPVTPEDPQVIPEPIAASHAPPRNRRRPLLLVGVAALLFVLLVGTGALAAIALNGGLDFSGGNGPATEVDRREATERTGVSGRDADRKAVGESIEDGDLRITLNSVRGLPKGGIYGTGGESRLLAFALTFENVSGEPAVVTSNDFSLVDWRGNEGTQLIHDEQRELEEGELRPGEKVSGEIVYEMQVFAQGMELRYEPLGKDRTYAWFVGDSQDIPDPDDAPPEPAPETTTEETATFGEQRFISDYYEAVSREDWEATYSMLDSESREVFGLEGWVRVQEAREARAPIPPIESAVATNIGGEEAGFTCDVELTYEDGSEEIVEGVVVYYEDGGFKRHLTDEEVSYLLNLGLAGEDVDEETLIETTIRGHYEAIGEGDFEEAYSYFGPAFRATTSEESWIAEEESYEITGSTVNSVVVEEISDGTATATVDVSFEDNTGTPRFVMTWRLAEEDREWKLDEVLSAEKVE